jgi:hypothetical protein
MVGLAMLGTAGICLAQQPKQKSFGSAEEAAQALAQAAQKHDEPALMATLGLGKDLLSLGDAVQDKLDRERFAQKYKEMHRLVREPDGTTVLYIGAENWPFPIPLQSNDQGTWAFDSSAGLSELLFRRIGENEQAAIQTCRDLANGVGDVDLTRPLHGYLFRRVDSPSGAGYVAYPVAYRSSGVMTFIAAQDGAVYERDLGENTAKAAKALSPAKHGSKWHPAQ